MKFVLMGPPGSGKGTQAGRLSETLGIQHISSGDILRDHVARKTPFGKKVKAFMDRGEIGPEELITEIVLRHVDENCPSGFILDGFPRTLYQADEIEKTHNIVAAILLEVSDEIVIARLSGRRVCETCRCIYHVANRKPRRENICDECGAKLVQRKDDTEETIRNRLEVYREQTEPVIDFYARKSVLKRINGNNDPDMVFDEIMNIV